MSYDLTKSRIWQWVGIIAILCLFGGAYWYFRSQAAQTITTSSDSARPDFEAPLISDLNLIHGIGSPTFSRADGANRRATVTDFEGLIRPVKSGEARFEGARRVENVVSYSEDQTNVTWAKSGLTASAGGTANGYAVTKLTLSGGNVLHQFYQSYTISDNAVVWSSLYVDVSNLTTKVVTLQDQRKDSTYAKVTFTWSGPTTIVPSSPLNALDYGYKIIGNYQAILYIRYNIMSGATSSKVAIFGNYGAYNGDGEYVYTSRAMVEDVTGQANQNPSEYVSANVRTTTPYHGASVDGVKYFATQNGNTVASNVVTEATGTAIPDATLHGYLAEGARTNLLIRSEQFNLVNWYTSSSSRTVDVASGPSGQITADKLVEDTSTNFHTIYQYITKPASSLPYAMTVYAKPAGRSWIRLVFQSTGGDYLDSYYDIQNGVLGLTYTSSGNVTLISRDITAASNGYYRISLVATTNTTTSLAMEIHLASANGTANYIGDGTSGLYLWGAQLEQASFASTYIPTTTASVARSIDTLSYPASGNIATNAGTVYAEHIPTESAADYGAIFNVYANGTNDGLDMIRNITTGATRANVRSGGTLMADISTGTSTLGTLSRNAFSWTTNAINVYKNGAVGTPDTSATMPTALGTNMYLGERPSGPIPLYGTLRNVKIWKQVMSGTFVQNLTAGQSGVIKQTTNKTANNTGLVGYWSFEDGTGTKATDFSENNNTGTLTNGPTWGDGKFGKAVNFDGTDDYIDAGNGSTLGFTGDISVSAWIKPTILSDNKFFVGKYSSVGDTGYDLGIMADGRVAATFRNGSHTDGFSSAGLVQTGVWQHILITQKVSGCSVQIYRNGVLSSTLSNQQCFTNPANNFFIGNRNNNVSNMFSGSIDEVRIYNRALTQEEITKLYQVTSTKINYNQNDKLTSGLVGLWSFNGPDVSGTTATDRSGSGNNGTLTNGPSVTPGKVGQALQFDGVNDYVRTGNTTAFDSLFSSGITVCSWVKYTNLLDYNRTITINDNANTSYDVWLQSVITDGKIEFGAGGVGKLKRSTTGVVAGIWYHVCGETDYTSGGTKIFINGVDDGGTVNSTPTYTADKGSLDIGVLESSGKRYGAGVFDEVRVYNRALTTDEISSLYNSGK